MKNFLLIGALCVVWQHAAWAMSFEAGGENLLYFEHARQSTEYCEQRGFPVRPMYLAWYQKNADVHRGAKEALETRAASGGLSRAERDEVFREINGNLQKQAQAQIARRGVVCKRFEDTLAMYTNLMKR